MGNIFHRNAAYIAFAQSLVATLASLYYSEVQHFAPCTLCWYQRIFLYPLVILIAVGIVRRDKNMPYYALPLSVIGLLIAFYHYMLERGIIPEALAPCTAGVSCTTRYIDYFGFISIPFLSLLSFGVITFCLANLLKNKERQ